MGWIGSQQPWLPPHTDIRVILKALSCIPSPLSRLEVTMHPRETPSAASCTQVCDVILRCLSGPVLRSLEDL